MSEANEQVVRDFMETWETHAGLLPGYDRYFADDCLWENTGLKPVRGKTNVLALVGRSAQTWGEYYMGTELHSIVSRDDLVLIERTDIMFTADGEEFLRLRAAAAFEIRNGGIERWSDYYDPKPMFAAITRFTGA